MSLLLKTVGIGLLVAFAAQSAVAQELPPGVSYQVVQEFPASAVPGARLVQETLFVMQPGAKLEGYTNDHLSLCIALYGSVKVVMGDKTIIRKAGDRWIEQPGETATFINEGDVAFVDQSFEIYWE